MNIHLETKRLILRDIRESDVQGMFELDSDPEVHRYLGNNPVSTIEQSEKVIQYIHKQYKENGIGRLAVIDKASGEFMGWSGLKLEDVIRKEGPYYDLGYRFKRKCWGKGIATESAIASLQFGFEQLKLEEICAAADVNNIGSNKVLQKVGMRWVETFEFEGFDNNWYRLRRMDWTED